MRRFLGLFVVMVLLWPLSQAGAAEPAASPDEPDVLRIAVYDSPPFGFREPNGRYSGMMVEIWEDIANELGFTYEYSLTDMDDLLTGLRDDRYDVGLGAITITPQRAAVVDFSQPVNPSGTGIGVSANEFDAFWTFWPPIFMSLIRLVTILFVVLIVSGTLLWLVERSRESRPEVRRIDGLGDGLWWAAVTMTTVGYGDKVPQTYLGRIIAILWMFTSIILVSLFTANASSIFTTVRVRSHIHTIEDLRRVEVGAAADSSGAEFLEREHVSYRSYTLVEEAIQGMLTGEIDCVVSNIPVMQHLKHTRYHDELVIAPEPLVRNSMGIALQEHSPYQEDIDQVLLRLITEPKWQRTVYRYLGEE